MSKTEINVNNLKINRGTYANIQANLSSIGENELILVTDKNIPVPTASDSTKLIRVNSQGEYELFADSAVQDSNYVHTDNNFTNTYKSNIEANNAKVSNVQSDWNASSGLAQILNKPTLGTAAAKDFTTSVTSGSSDLVTSGAVYTSVGAKQDTLVSGTNIKTVHNSTVLGSGNLTVIEVDDGNGTPSADLAIGGLFGRRV